MTYSFDMRKRAVGLVNEGRSRQEVCSIFGIDRKTLYNWTRSVTLLPQQDITRRGKINKDALLAHVRDNPDMLLRERAHVFGVRHQSLWMMLKRLDITKKNHTLSGE